MNHFKIKFSQYLRWMLFWIIIACLLFIIIYLLDCNSNSGVIKHSKITISTMSIIKHNTWNFMGYFLLFPFSIIMLIFDLFNIVLNIYVAWSTYGWHRLWLRLMRHGIIEAFNILFYSYLAYKQSLIFYRTKKLSNNICFIKQNKVFYFISYIVLILAAILEGGTYG